MNRSKTTFLLLSTLWLALLLTSQPASAAPPPQTDPAAQCAEGVKLFNNGQKAETLPLLEAGFAGRETATFAHPDDEGMCALALGILRGETSNYSGALEAFQVALDIFQASGNREYEGNTLSNIGLVYYYQMHHEEALEAYEQALPIHREVGDQAGEGATLNNIGLVYNNQVRYEEALEHFQQALVIEREVDNRAWEGATLVNIGLVYDNQGRYEEALEHFQQALVIEREVVNRAGEGATLNSIGGVYHSQGRFEEALGHFQQALVIEREVGDRAGKGVTLNNIGGVYHSQGRYEEALATFEQALTIADEADNWFILHNIRSVYAIQGRSGKAPVRYNQSPFIYYLDYRFRMIDAIHQVSEWSLIDAWQYQRVLSVYEQAPTIHYKQATTIHPVGNPVWQGQARMLYGFMYDDLGRYAEALEAYQQAMDIFEEVRVVAGSEERRASFIAQYADLYARAVALFHQQIWDKKAFFTSERGRARAFLDSLATGYVQLSDNVAADLLTREQEAYAQRQAVQDALAKARALNPPDPELVADLETQLAEAEQAYAAVQAEIKARGGQLADLVPGRSQNVLGVAEVQALLDEQTTLLAYYILEEQTLVFLITADSFEVIELDVSREELTKRVDFFRKLVDLKETDTTRQKAQELYQVLIAPLANSLNTPRLIIVPHGVLHYLPFAALLNPHTDQYLLERYSMVTLPSASALPFIQENAGDEPGMPLIVGNPTTASDLDTTASLPVQRKGLDPLPFAEKEAKTIASLYGVEPLLGAAATEGAVREQVGGMGILHLAAHGYYNPVAPLSSLIALAPDATYDGWLTVGEVYDLDLSQTDLVVLSACQTQLGELSKGDELVGLTRAFIFAGTPTVVASLWNVDDEATSFLMERFYRHLQEGTGKAEALRQAQLETMAEYPDPYYWAAFAMSGDGGEVSPRAVGIGDVGLTARVSEKKNNEEKSTASAVSRALLIGGIGLLLVAIVGGGLWWWRLANLGRNEMLRNGKLGCKIRLFSLLISNLIAGTIIYALYFLLILSGCQPPRDQEAFTSQRNILIIIVTAALYLVYTRIAPRRLEKRFKAQFLASLPAEARQHLEQAYDAEEKDDFENALRGCEAAIQLAPEWAEAHNLRGIVLEALDRTDEAIAAYRKAVRLDPAFEDARQNLREALAEAGVE